MGALNYHEHTHCRVCGSDRLETYLDLGAQPLANAFRQPEDTSPELTVPLQLARCLDCDLSQLRHVVDPDVLYRDYLYESGHSEGWKRHCVALAGEICDIAGKDALVCDIACNDGVLLRACLDRGLRVYGVDPARNIPTGSIPVIRDYWTCDLAAQCASWPGKPDVIVAQNVLGHVDDVCDFLSGISLALRLGGTAIIECPHIMPLLERGAFDTVYHEHLSYWSLRPLQRLASQADLTVVDVTAFPDLHGGTVRYSLRHAGLKTSVPSEAVNILLVNERIGLVKESYDEFVMVVTHTLERLRRVLLEDGPVYAYGASAKSTVLFNALGSLATENIRVVYDDTPGKHGLAIPGFGIPVLCPPNDFSSVKRLLITAPNWSSQIKEKVMARGFTGEFIEPWYGVQVEAACPASS